MLTIEVISYNERPLPRPQLCEFDETGGTIGRRKTSTLCLEDPERMNDGSAISRDHARIEYQAGRYVIIDNGANPLLLNNRSLGKGKEALLADGDQLRIGDYVLQVRLRQTGTSAPGASVPRVEPTWGTETSRESGIDTVVSADSLRQISRGVIADKPPTDRRHDVQNASEADKQGTSSAGDMVVSWRQENTPERPSDHDLPITSKGNPAAQVARRERASIRGATELKAPPSGQGAHCVKSKWEAGAPSDGTPLPDALLQAFIVGAGNPKLAMPQGFDAKTLFQLGELMRATVEGILQLLKVRSETKAEVGAKLTIIAPYVNPLKFSPDADFALQQLVASQSQGFMPPLEAIHDAFSDLISHQVGLLAGLDAAMNSLIDRFAPDNLERQLIDKNLLDAVIPFKEKAKLWDLFEAKFDDIKDKAREGIDNAFKTEFLKAYENKVAELRRSRMPDAGCES